MIINDERIDVTLNDANNAEISNAEKTTKSDTTAGDKRFNVRSRIEDLREQKALERMMNDYGDLDWH